MDRIEKNLDIFIRGVAELREAQKETDAQMKKTDAQMKRTDEKLEKIGIQLGGMGLVQGEVAEDLFYRNVSSVFNEQEFYFNRVHRNLKKKGAGDGGAALANSKNFRPREFS